MTYVSKRFRTFRKPITRKFARGGVVPGPGPGGSTCTVARDDPEMIIPLSMTVTGASLWLSNAKWNDE